MANEVTHAFYMANEVTHTFYMANEVTHAFYMAKYTRLDTSAGRMKAC